MVTAHEALNDALERIENPRRLTPEDLEKPVPPRNVYGDLKRQKICENCSAEYTAEFPEFLASRARSNGKSQFWDAFRGEGGKCPKCVEADEREKQRLERLKEIEEQKRHRANRWNSEICPPTYRKTDESRLPNLATHRTVQKWQFGPRGMLIPGPSGSGKTRAVYTLAGRLYVEENRSIRIFDCISFNHEATRMAMDSEKCESWARKLVEVDLLIFDDLGKFRLTDRVESELFAVVERRCAWEKPIIATTNDNGDSLKARMSEDRGGPMIRRLKEFCEIVPFA